MQINVLNGIYTDDAPDFRTAYPLNFIPVPKEQGISKGYLRPADGIVEFGVTTEGTDRGGINWDGAYYRVMGSKLIKIATNGTYIVIGEVGDDGKNVTMDYSFDRLAIASNEDLFYWDNSTFVQVTDPDLGEVLDVVWVDGYFMTTDGEFLVVTELSDPTQVNPLKYGSAEASPDPVNGLLKLRNEIYALNRYSIEVFANIGTSGFPFQRIASAIIDRGCIGTHASAVFLQSIAFLGGGPNEAPAIWLGNNATTVKISTREVDQVLLEFTEAELNQVIVEAKVDKGHEQLLIHLPTKTLVYYGNASQVLGTPVWSILSSGSDGDSIYRGKNLVFVYDKWHVGDTNSFKYGYLDDSISTHYGDKVSWEFTTTILYNESRGAIIHQMELVALTGRVANGITPTISTSYSLDGLTFTSQASIKAGNENETLKRLVWLFQGSMANMRLQRFSGDSDTHISIARLEARIEPLNA